MKNYICMGTLCMFLLGSCVGHEHGSEGHDHEAEMQEKTHTHSDEIILAPEKAEAAGVKVETVQPGKFRETIHTSGQILAAQGNESTIVASAAGVVSFSRKITEGMQVGKGAELMSISAEHLQDGDPLKRAQVAYRKAKDEYERALKLAESKIVSQKDLEALYETYENTRLAFEALSPSKSGKGLAVKSPIGGYVKSCLVKEGDYVTAGQPLMTVTQTRRLMLRAEVSERYYAELPQVASASFKTACGEKVYQLENLNGHLLSYGKSSGDTSYYIPVIFEFDNRGDILPGSFAEVYLLTSERQGVVSLPVSAVTEEQGLNFVYIRMDAEGYKKQEVKLGGTDGARVEILSGLKGGEEVVTQGAMHIKLASASNAIPAHTHNH